MNIYCNGFPVQASRLGHSWYCHRCGKKVKVVW